MATTSSSSTDPTPEKTSTALSGWVMLLLNLALLIGGIALFIFGIVTAADLHRFSWLIPLGPLVALCGFISLFGLFTLQPNVARVMILFGDYHGTIRKSGFFWANPFYARNRGRVELPGAPWKNAQTGRTETPHRTLGSKISL